MEFVLQQEKQEAERKRIQAQGVSDANAIVNEGLSPAVLQYKAIEAWLQLSMSPNAKTIITTGGGAGPAMLNVADESPIINLQGSAKSVKQ